MIPVMRHQKNNRLDRPMEKETTALRLERVSKAFKEGGKTRSILENATISLYHGEFVVLLGKSGSGKSTLLNLVSGIEMPTSGRVFIGGTSITELSEKDRTLFRRDHIGFIFQFFNLIPTLTVMENVTLPLELAGVPGSAARAAAIPFLAKVGLETRRDSFPDRLSGGEQQRVAIARALVHDPTLILADEPTGNLDDETGRVVLELLLDLAHQAGKGLIMATHNPEIVGMADRILRIQEGGLVETGYRKEIA